MGIRADIEVFSEADAAALARSDDLLARVLADFARERAAEVTARNRKATGKDVAAAAAVNGRPVAEVTPEVVLPALRPGPADIAYQWAIVTAGGILAVPWSVVLALKATIGGRMAGRLALHVAERAVLGRDERDPREDVADLLAWVAGELWDRSPVVSGDYRAAHALFADSEEVGAAAEIKDGADIPLAAEYVFVNPQPYARKIEVGTTRDGRDFVIQVPNRIYEHVADDAAAKFGDVARIRSEWRDDGAMPAPTNNAGRPLRYPAIVIRPR